MTGIFKINLSDLLKGLIVSVLTACLTIVTSAIANGGVGSINWGNVGAAAALAAGGYVLKNLLTDASGAALGIVATQSDAAKEFGPPRNNSDR